VEIALQSLPLALAGFDHPSARALQLLEPCSQVDVKPAVLERDSGRGADGVEALGLVVERGVVHQRREMYSVAVDQRGAPPVVVCGKFHRATFLIRPALELRQPIGERQGRITEGSGEGVAEVGRPRISVQLDHQVADRGAREPGVEQRD
jgi:hypothetical protein